MNILMITERYLPIWGGAENQLQQLIPRLTERGCSIRVVTRRWHSDMLTVEYLDNTEVVRLGVPGNGIKATVIFVVALFAFVIKNRKSIDILHSHGAVNMGALCSLLSLILGKKNVAKIATAGRIPTLQKTFIGKSILRVFSMSGAIISMTEEIDKEVESIKINSKRIQRITNGVDGRRFKPLNTVDRATLRDEIGLDTQVPAVLFSSRLVPRKGLDVIINAWPRILEQHPRAWLLVLGSGADQPDSVEEDIKDFVLQKSVQHVKFLGETSSPERFYALSDIFVFPSRKEGFPNALMEALTVGLPVVASRIGGVVDIVTSEQLGLLFPSGDSKELAEHVASLLDDIDKAGIYSKERRDYMLENFSFDSIASQYCSLYTELSGC